MPLSHVVVLIPARNEEDLLPRCLYSVLRACAALPRSISYDIVVAVDSSVDRTRDLATEILAGYGAVVVTNAGCVGQARIEAADSALRRYRGPLEACWLANTDADCCVPESWLLDQLELAEGGMHAIAGVIQVDSFAEHQPEVPELFRTSYILHEDGTHPHVHGANIGVRADAYVKAGGWKGLTTAEDHDLWGRLQQAGVRRISAARLSVITSGRKMGRAPHGFAGALAAHNGALPAEIGVETR